MQIIEIETDRIDDLVRLEDEWRVAGRGRRTGTADWICADRNQPGRYFSVNLFPSHEAATVNGALPETNTLADHASRFATATFHDCEVTNDVWGDELDGQAQKLAQMFATTVVPDDLFADDVVVELNVPHGRQDFHGIGTVRRAVPTMLAPARIEEQPILPMIGGFVLELALRAGAYSRQVCVAETTGGLVRRLDIYCTGDFS